MADNPQNVRTAQIPGVSDEDWELFKQLAKDVEQTSLGQLLIIAVRKAYANELPVVARAIEARKAVEALREVV